MNFIAGIRNGFDKSFHALSHKNFRYFWIGQCISLIGTWMQNIAQAWLVFTLTKSPFLLGLVGVVQFMPVLLFSLFAGAFIDKLPKKKILVATQAVLMLQASILAFLVWTGNVRYWHVLVLGAVLGIANTLDMPARQSFFVELVGREDLMNAIALNSSIFNAARIIGPGLAGLLMAYAGTAFCFLVNALSFIAVIWGLLCIRVKSPENIKRGGNDSNILQDIWEGLVYVGRDEFLRKVILTVAVVGTFAMNFNVLVPVFAKNVLGQGETGYAFLMSSLGVGSLVGAVVMATKSRTGPVRFLLTAGPAVIPVLLIITGFTGTYHLTAIFLAITGIFNVSFFTTANSSIQLSTRDEFRGRVMSVYTLVFGGTIPFGNFFAGSIADRFGPGMGFVMCGAVILLLGVVIWLSGRRQTDRGNPT